jgi:uncharacterized protein
MRKNGSTRLKVTDNLLMIERGREELILTDYVDLQPLYIKKGKRYIKSFLKAASELKTQKRTIEAFPQDADLLDTLLNHKIIVPHSLKRSEARHYSQEEPDLHHKASMSLYLLISQSCNMSCVYYLNGSKTYQIDKTLRMDREIAFKSIERCLTDISPGGSLEVVFFGGEPMLNWPLVKEAVTYCEESLKQTHPQKHIRRPCRSPKASQRSMRADITSAC